MQLAQQTADSRRADHAKRNDPAFVREERARKKRERAEQHEMRVATKAARDWLELTAKECSFVGKDLGVSELAVILEAGDRDTGPYDGLILSQRVEIKEQAAELKHRYVGPMIRAMAAETVKIASGFREGYFVDDGCTQFIQAMVVGRGSDEEIIPISGFAFCWSPITHEYCRVDEAWEESVWTDYFPDEEG